MRKEVIPAISIIIPMYNVEKFIGECLDSILAQTFDDYELIVVDDCSTDNSAKIVESYVPKFGGRLQLVLSKVNSSGAGVPRNTGFKMARGEYVYFMDADDAITNTALEEMYSAAKKFNVDVTHCERFYLAPGTTVTTNKRFLKIYSCEKVDFVSKPTFVSEYIGDRIEDFTTYKFWNAPWIHLIRREFLQKNDIYFPNLRIGDDIIFNFYIICLTKSIIRIPNIYYVWRANPNSNTKAKLSPEKYIARYGNSIMKGIGLIEKFKDKCEFLKENPEYKFKMFDFFTRDHINRIVPLYSQIPIHELDKFIRHELEQIEDKTALTAFLFDRMCIFNLNYMINSLQSPEVTDMQDKLQQAATYLTKQSEIIDAQQAEIKRLRAQLR